MTPLQWTKHQAREYLVSYHFINSSPAESIHAVFDRLRLIQTDPLNVVGRNTELVLQSRVPGFQKDDLYDALYQDRLLIDAWDKQMSVYLTDDYPKLHPIRAYRAELQLNALRKYAGIEALDHADVVLDIIREQGPIFSRDIKIGEAKHFYWGPMKPSTATLDYLFHLGKIGIHSRQNTQKKYDLIERLIPNHLDPYHFDSEDDFIDWFLLRRVRAAGIVWNKGTTVFLNKHIKTKRVRTKHFKRLCDQGLLTAVQVENIDENLYVPTDALERKGSIEDRISFIAPLDNMIWERDLIKQLFDFDYKWEVYVPAKKREYGYYVLPILRGSHFIGRIEFEKHRNTDPLQVKQIWWEAGIVVDDQLHKLLDQALSRFAAYLNAKGAVR